MRRRFLSFKYSICISALTVCLKPARSPGADLLSLRHKRAAWESSAASATRTDWHIFACVHMWRHRSLLPSNARHGSTLGERQDGWSRCVRIAMWEFPKAMKYAGCNGRANSLNLTTYVQRKGLLFVLLAKQHTCPVNTVSICTHLWLCSTWLLFTRSTLESLFKPKNYSNFGTVSLFSPLYCKSLCHSPNWSKSSNTSAQFSG